jgi:uncharacterized membrane protein YqjE
MADGEHSGGLFTSVRRMADTCLNSVHNRVELFSVELQEEKIRLMRLLLWTGAALFSAFLAITVITIAIVLAFPQHSVWTIPAFGVLYLLISVATALKLRSEVRNAPPPLNDTLAELKKDLEYLRSKSN